MSEVETRIRDLPKVIGFTAKTITVEYIDDEGTPASLEIERSKLKGQAQWAARQLQILGATVPEYGTRERRDWAKALRHQLVQLEDGPSEDGPVETDLSEQM